MTFPEARAYLKAHAKQAVEAYRFWTALGFQFCCPIELAEHLAGPTLVPPPLDEPSPDYW